MNTNNSDRRSVFPSNAPNDVSTATSLPPPDDGEAPLPPIVFLHFPNDDGRLVRHDKHGPKIIAINSQAPVNMKLIKVDRKHLETQIVGVDLMCDFGLHNQCYDRVASGPRSPHFLFRFHFAGCAELQDTSTMSLDVVPSWKALPGQVSDIVADVRCWSVHPEFAKPCPPLDSVLSTAIINPRFHAVITGKFILDLVTENNLNTFSFSFQNGGGCRHWIYELAKIMEDMGITRPEWSHDVLSRLESHWNHIPGKRPEPSSLPSHKLNEGVFRETLSPRKQQKQKEAIVAEDIDESHGDQTTRSTGQQKRKQVPYPFKKKQIAPTSN